MKDIPNIVEFITDRQLLNLTLSPAQETIHRAIYALGATPEQRAIYRELSGRSDWPVKKAGEVTIVGGVRGGKDSRLQGPIACYEGLFAGHERHLAKGERGIGPLIYQDARASRVGAQYIESYLTGSSLLRTMVADVTKDEITLVNGLSIRQFPNSAAGPRAWSIPFACLNEVGSWAIEGQANSDAEIQSAVRRGMVAFPNSLLLKCSTPWLKSGILWDDFQRFGQPDPDRLVFRAPSWILNPSLVGRLEREKRIDPVRFEREFGARFGDVLAQALLDQETIAACIPAGLKARPPHEGQRVVGHLDMSTGIGSDALGFALACHDGQRATLLYTLHLPPPFNPREAVSQVAHACRRYSISQITIDKFSPGLVLDLLRHEGVEGRLADSDTSAAFISLLMLMNTGGVSLLDSDLLRRELAGLQRKPSTGGRDVVGHGGGGHDDLAAAVAFAIAAAAREGDQVPFTLVGSDSWYAWIADRTPADPDDDAATETSEPEPGVLERITSAATAAKDAIFGAITGVRTRVEIARLPQLRGSDDHWIDPVTGMSPYGSSHLDAQAAHAAKLIPASTYKRPRKPKAKVPRTQIEASIASEGWWRPGDGQQPGRFPPRSYGALTGFGRPDGERVAQHVTELLRGGGKR